MKYHIDTIPVLDAFEMDGCRICAMQRKVEAEYAEGFLGDSVMEPDVRIQVNRLGFCPEHWSMLYSHPNKLATALLLQTHLKELRAQIGKADGKRACKQLDNRLGSCILCSRLEKTMNRLAYTVVYMYYKEPGFKEMFQECGGFCLPHHSLLLNAAAEYGGAKSSAFLSALHDIQSARMDEVINNIDGFTKQFDYRSVASAPESVKGAVAAAIKHLCSEEQGGL